MGNVASSAAAQAAAEERLSHIPRGKENVGDSKNARLVHSNLVMSFNTQDRKLFQAFSTPDSVFGYLGAEATFPLDLFMKGVVEIIDSFPNVCATFDEIKEIEPDLVRITNLHSRGNHTGKPFQYGPCPPIQPVGTLVDEVSQFYIRMSKGKMKEVYVEMKEGDLVGPAGYYVKLGGDLRSQIKAS